VLKSGDMERVMPLLAWHMEEPRLGQSYPNFFAAKLASRFVKVVLSGCGGDELFAGYPWRYYRVMDCRSFEDYIDRYYAYWQRLIPNAKLLPLLAPIASEVGHVWTRDIFCNVFRSHAHAPESFAQSVNLSLYFEAKTFLSSLLMVEDKLSMAHGLEVRLPFLDNDVVDFACGLPVAYKLHNIQENIRINENLPGKTQQYYRRYDDGKHILRQVMGRFVPETVSTAPKQGFSGPDASWFRGESIDYLRKTIMTPSARVWEYLDYGVASKLVDEHLSGQENRRLFIWSLLSVEWWLRKYL
jgi:asparagine synthase (glutamine-hydrolysing)